MITYGSTTLTSYNSITSTEVYYYKSSSATALSGGSWSTTKPAWENGKYIWQKIRTLYEDETYTESDPVNITGQQGATGAAAYSYKLNASDTIIGKTKTGEYTVNKITFSATSKQGTSAVTAYSGRFKIETTEDGSTWTTSYTSSANESSKEFTIPENIVAVKCSLYQAGGVTVLLDIVTIPVVKDGVDAIGLKDSIPIYLASDKATGVTKLDLGWTRYRPELTAEKKYLWVYYVSRFSEGDTDPELIEIKDDVVSFENHGDVSPVESCIVDINPIQEINESEEINPINGWNNITATRTGKNLLKLPEYEEIITYEIQASYYKIPIKLFPNTDYYLYTEYLNDYTSKGKSYCYVLMTSDPNGNSNWKAIGHSSSGIVNGTMKSTLDGYLFLKVYNGCSQKIYDELKNNCEAMLSVGTTPVTYEPYQRTDYQCSVESAENKNLVIYDKEPYLFRKSKSSQIKFLEEDIIGGTVCWNQFVQNGDFTDDTDNWQVYPSSGGTLTATNNIATFTMNQTSGTKTVMQQVNKIPVDHVVLWGCDVKTTTDNAKIHVCIYYNSSKSAASNINTRLWLASPEIGYDDTWYNRNIITRNADANAQYILVGTASGTTNTNVTVEFKNVQLFDLTQMFGTEIADYILELEQSEKGAGVAWFRKYFPNDYYDYNPGELMHVSDLQSHDMVGFNLFDPSAVKNGKVYGYIDVPIGRSNQLKMVLIDKDTSVPLNDISLGFVSSDFSIDEPDGKPLTSENFRWCLQDGALKTRFLNLGGGASSYGTKLLDRVFFYPKTQGTLETLLRRFDICVHLVWSGTRDGEYEPYVKHSYPLDPSLTLRGIPKLTADGDLTYDGDIYKPDGTVERRYGIVDLGTLSWIYNSTSNAFVTVELNSSIKKTASDSDVPKFIQNKYNQLPRNQVTLGTSDKVICENTTGSIVVSDLTYTDVTALKASLSGVYFVYELAEPTIEQAQPYASSQLIDDWGTEEYITDSIVPVGHETNYYNNTVYGGQYNITTGELTVTYDVVDLGTLTYSTRYTGTNNKVLSTELPFNPESGLSLIAENYSIIGSVAGAAALSPPDDHDKGIYRYGNQNEKTIYIVCGIEDNPKGKLVYKIAESKNYSLTPQEVTALTGQNYVYADSGEVTINYYDNQKSTEPYVDYSYLSTFETAQIAKEVAETALLQIDGKIETWCQSTDPAIAWITDELKNQHDGDLWYYTGESTNSFNNNTTYKYTASNNTWVAYSASADLFDKIDNKTSIYYGTTASITTAETGDYLVDSTDGSSYRWDGNNWVKVTDYKTAIDDIEIGGRNLYINKNDVNGYIITNGTIANQSATYKEHTSEYIPVSAGETYILQTWNEVDDLGDKTLWLGYTFYSDAEGTHITGRPAKYGEVGDKYLAYDSIVIPENAHYIRVSYRKFDNGLIKLEKGNKPTAWSPAPEDTDSSIQQLQSDLDNLEIGSRNLMLTPEVSYTPTAYSAYDIKLTEDLLADQTYTLQLWNVDVSNSAKTAEQLGIFVYYCGGSVAFGSWLGTNYFTNGHADYLSLTFTPTTAKVTHSNVVNALYKFIRLYNSDSNVTDATRNMSVGKWKLEKGNRGTDWSPAPEDVENSIKAYAESIQSQVDGMAEIHYGTAVPTLSNAPYTSWKDTATRDMHVDDLYYNTSTGYCYRFIKSGSTYSWSRIKDSDITAAATAASNANTAAGNAQTTANNANTLAGQKRRIFVNQPTPPYEVGDLWVEGSNGDIKKCKTARATGNYTASDWELASKYTDDTLANEANDKIDNLEIGGRNLLPFKDCSSETLTRGGITLTKEEDGWIRVSGTRSETSLTTFTLWQNPDGDTYTAPINSYVPQNGNTNQFTLSVETEGTPFIMGNTYTSSTHIVAYGSTSGTSWRIGGINGTSITGVFPTYMSVIRYYIGANSTGTVNGRFRVKLERGNKATDWSPAPEDTETAISDVQDTANTALIQSSWYAICDTAGATIDKVATISPATTSFTLREGTTAIIKFVNTNSGAIGSLKLDVNNTGAKPIKYIYNGGLSNIPSPGYLKGGQSYQFYYDGTNWVVQMIYNTNTNTVGVYGGTVTVGTNGIRGYTLIMRDTENTWVSITTDAGAGTKDGGTGTNHVKYAGGLYPDSVMYESTQTNYAAGASAAVCYLALSLNLRYSTNCGTTLIKNKPVYLVGELHNDGLFYLDDIWWTQTIPTTENGKTYIYLGMAYSNYQIYLATEKPMYQYYDGEFMTYEDVQTALAAKSATNYMSSDNTGIMVADMTDGVEKLPSDTTLTGSNVFITAGYGSGNTAVPAGVHIRDGRTDIARFGATAQIGRDDEGHVLIDNDSVDIKKGNVVLASFGTETTIGKKDHAYLKQDGSATHVYGYDNSEEVISYGVSNDKNTGLRLIAETKEIISYGNYYGNQFSCHIVSITSCTINGNEINVSTLGYDNDKWIYQSEITEGKMRVYYTTDENSPYLKIGRYNTTSGIRCATIGSNLTASGINSLAIGDGSIASGYNSFAEGSSTIASGENSHAEGFATTASGENSYAGGVGSQATAYASFAIGEDTIANQSYQFVTGSYNKTNQNALFIIGNSGYSNGEERGNAFEVMMSGNTISRGSITADKSDYEEASSSTFKAIAGAGNGQAGNSIGLMASNEGNVGLYNYQKNNWDLVHTASTDKTTIPFLGFTSTATGTVASTFNGANTKSCLLYKVGKIVFMNLALHYTNASSTIATNTTMFTIPTGYRPASESTILANIDLKVTSSTTNPCATCTLKISTAGAITQAYSSNIYSIYAFGMWETS